MRISQAIPANSAHQTGDWLQIDYCEITEIFFFWDDILICLEWRVATHLTVMWINALVTAVGQDVNIHQTDNLKHNTIKPDRGDPTDLWLLRLRWWPQPSTQAVDAKALIKTTCYHHSPFPHTDSSKQLQIWPPSSKLKKTETDKVVPSLNQ